MADLPAEVPQQIERRLDQCGGALLLGIGGEEHEIDVAERRHFASAGAAKPDESNGRCSPAWRKSRGGAVERQAEQLVGEEGVAGGRHPASSWLFAEPPLNLGAP